MIGAVLLLAGTASGAPAEVGRWSVIRDQSSIGMSVRALGMTHAGRFTSWTSSDIRFFDERRDENADGAIDVRAASLTMRQGALSRQAIGPDFLDAEHYPLIRFRLRSVTLEDRTGALRAYADVTIKGQTRQVGFRLGTFPEGNGGSITGSFTIDRRDFGVGGTSGLNGLVGDNVRIDVSLVVRRRTL